MKDILKQIKLLYVEDDQNIRSVLSRGLKRTVQELEVAVDGVDGLEKFKSFAPDIIVTDIRMPRMDGLDMLRAIREINKTVPIIITSAHGESETIIDAIESGVNGYILKPIDKDKLFNTIGIYAKSIVLEKELSRKNNQLLLQSKNAALGELIENIAHQWRQPLSVISATASTLLISSEFDNITKESLDSKLNTILDTTQELSRTIDTFRKHFTSNDSEIEEFSLIESIKDILQSLSSKLILENVNIIKNIDETIVLKNYSNLFLQSLINIMCNSFDIFEDKEIDKKFIFIDIYKENNKIKISIKDNAGGIANEIKDKIFEPYFTTKHKSQGKGLGLYSTLIMIQEGMSGEIEVSNEEFEYDGKNYKGAVFTITL